MEKTKEIYMYLLGALVVLSMFSIIAFLVFYEIPSPNKELLYMLLGVLAAKFSDVIGYFYGSSKGSADKTNLMKSPLDKVGCKDRLASNYDPTATIHDPNLCIYLAPPKADD